MNVDFSNSKQTGKFLKEALLLPTDKYGRQLRTVIEAIHSVHLVSQLNPIRVNVLKMRDNDGEYIKHRGTGEPQTILINKKGDHLELTFAHEIGHFLEGTAIPGSSFGVRQWETDSYTAGWRS